MHQCNPLEKSLRLWFQNNARSLARPSLRPKSYFVYYVRMYHADSCKLGPITGGTISNHFLLAQRIRKTNGFSRLYIQWFIFCLHIQKSLLRYHHCHYQQSPELLRCKDISRLFLGQRTLAHHCQDIT